MLVNRPYKKLFNLISTVLIELIILAAYSFATAIVFFNNDLHKTNKYGNLLGKLCNYY